jgi:hypothetical protein
METYTKLNEMTTILKNANEDRTNHVANIRKLLLHINKLKNEVLANNLTMTDNELNTLQQTVNDVVENHITELNFNIETTFDVEMFQLGASTDNVIMNFDNKSVMPPEHGMIIQKLWKIRFNDNTTGHMIVSDTSDQDLSTVLNAQLSTALKTAPLGAVEDLNVTITLSQLRNLIQSSQDISSLFNTLEKPAPIARELRDIDIDTDPGLTHLTTEQKTELKNSALVLNSATSDEEKTNAQNNLTTIAQSMGLFSSVLGPLSNLQYSDLKKFNLIKDDNSTVTVIASMPVVSWGDDVLGIPLRNLSGIKNKSNQKNPGTSYIVDMGGKNPAIRQGFPNPLPPTRYFSGGPNGATDTEGALDRYNGGKCLAINTTNQSIEVETLLREKNGIETLSVPAMSGIWKLDRATFDLGNRHAYYTVFSASRAPPSGFMGVVLAPKQNRLGRGRGEIASGVTLANGISKTGKTFNNQDTNGALLDNGQEVPSGLKGLTSAFDGHGMHPADLLKFLQDNNFIKGTQYLTIPANATLETVEDVLIPAGQFVPVITQAVGTLMQFGNGKYIQDGGPTRFQPGLIPFLPGTLAYTPEWHINWIHYNFGDFICDDRTYPIREPALSNDNAEWIRPDHNASFGPPGPSTDNTPESRYNPAVPELFDPVQLRCKIKWTPCLDYIKEIKGSKDGEISLSMLPQLENENKIFITEAPGGALRGWVKFLVVNCPLPIVIKVNVVGQEEAEPNPSANDNSGGNCVTCTCSRSSTMISINGALNPIWLDEDDEGNDTVIGPRVLNFKVGDDVIIRSTTGTMHGVSLRMDNMTTHTEIDNGKTLAEMQSEVLTEVETLLTINNKDQLENNVAALTDDLINFHGGIPITFIQKASANPIAFPDGVVIADFTIKEEARGSTGSVGCTVHGSSMSFKFNVCDV